MSSEIDLSPIMSLKQKAKNCGWWTSTTDLGLCHRWLTKVINDNLDDRVTVYLKEFETGRALTDIDFPFTNKRFPAEGLSRFDGSIVSQILANHFPSEYYFSRFKITCDQKLCNCVGSIDDRDHLIFECPKYIDERKRFAEKVNVHSYNLSWSSIFYKWQEFADWVRKIFLIWS